MASGKTSKVQDYATARLRGTQPDGTVVDRLTVSLKERDHFRLVYLAERMGASQGQLLTDLLTAAIDDAMAVLEPGSWQEYLESWHEHNPTSDAAEDQFVYQDYQRERETFDQALADAYREWMRGGKGPRGLRQSEEMMITPYLHPRSSNYALPYRKLSQHRDSGATRWLGMPLLYRYAQTADGYTVDVMTLPREGSGRGGPYVCLGCGMPLIAKTRGVKKVQHFAHARHVSCTGETYLHRLAKLTFAEVYRTCLREKTPFLIKMAHKGMCDRYVDIFNSPCTVPDRSKTYDLTRRYDVLSVEERDDSFIPDILISASTRPGDRIYIEIAVTHALSEKKASSAHKIIEIPVQDELDIGPITERLISDDSARFVGFPQEISLKHEDCRCATTPFCCLFIYKSGKSYLAYAPLNEIIDQQHRMNGRLLYARIYDSRRVGVPSDRGALYAQMLREARQNGVVVRNCLLCPWARPAWERGQQSANLLHPLPQNVRDQ